MMRSLFSAVSGLKTHQTRMDVIGNNIANVNTEAFKASSVRFSELMYQTMSTASGGDASTGTGGVNAKQVGLGVSTASTMINITGAGSSETTGYPFDLKLSDSQTTNFFIVSDGTNTMFTRAGSFYVDGNGYLCMSSTGYTVQGWQVDKTTGEIHKDTVSPLQVMSPSNTTSAPEATTEAYVHGILDKEDTDVTGKDGYVMTLGFYDDLGYSYTAKFAVSTPKANGLGAGNNYFISLTDILDSNGNSIITDDAGKALSDDAKRKKLDEIWGADGKADDTATNAPKGFTPVTRPSSTFPTSIAKTQYSLLSFCGGTGSVRRAARRGVPSVAGHIHKDALVGGCVVVRIPGDPLGHIVSIAAEDALHLLVLGLLLFDLLVQRLQFRTPGTDGHLIGDVGHQHTQQQQNEEKTKDRPHKRAASALFPGGICHFSAPPVLSRPETPVLLL